MTTVSVKLTSILSSSTVPTTPQMFQITAVTTTSLSFSWQRPANPNGAITGYELSCQPLLLDIPTPEPLSPGPTARMIVLADLHPGVRYNCSIAAVNSGGSSPLTYADDTTTEIGKDVYVAVASFPGSPRVCCIIHERWGEILKFVFVHSLCKVQGFAV